MNDLAPLFASLERAHVATRYCPLPDAVPGITWIVARNGLFKRGTNAHLDALICVEPWTSLQLGDHHVGLLPSARWRQHRGRLCGRLLSIVLDHARQAATIRSGIAQPVEQFYMVGLEGTRMVLVRPPQHPTSGHVTYEVPAHIVALADIHSHHAMPAYFSSTDDQDDRGLSVSVVVGRVWDSCPEIVCRINVHGHRQIVPVETIFDDVPLVCDRGAAYAPACN